MAAKKKSGGRKYSKAASKKVGHAMHERKSGSLKSGSSGRASRSPTGGKRVKSKKQAVAIGLSEARRAGKKAPKKKSSTRSKKRSSSK